MSENLKEIYKGKKFIFIEGAKQEKLGFVKGQDMSYRENDIYVYEEDSNMEVYVDKINKELSGSSLSAKYLTTEEMIKQNQELLQKYTDRKKLKDEYQDKFFLFISNGTRNSEEVQGKDMLYKNNDIYIYDVDANLSYISSEINKELGFHQSEMKSEVLNFLQMKQRNVDDLLIEKLESKKEVRQDVKKSNKSKVKLS